MKHVHILIALTGLLLFSCKKNSSVDPLPTSLNGKWRMVMVKDNLSGASITKPSSVRENVEITFTSLSPSNGTFTGNTPTNSIGQNDYLTGENHTLTIPALSMTKVMETSWGSEFVDNIRASTTYSFEIGGKLNIKTINKTLTFQKL